MLINGFSNWLNDDSFYEVLKFAYLRHKVIKETAEGIDDSPSQRLFLKLFEGKSIADLAGEDAPDIKLGDFGLDPEDPEYKEKIEKPEFRKQAEKERLASNEERKAARRQLLAEKFRKEKRASYACDQGRL